jgi:hypothetical protein
MADDKTNDVPMPTSLAKTLETLSTGRRLAPLRRGMHSTPSALPVAISATKPKQFSRPPGHAHLHRLTLLPRTRADANEAERAAYCFIEDGVSAQKAPPRSFHAQKTR